MKGKWLMGGLLIFTAVFASALWYFQNYAYYEVTTPDDFTVEMTLVGGDDARAPIPAHGFTVLDSETSPLKFRACFTVENSIPRLTETFVIVPEESEARYSINEVFISDNNALVTAIGRTTAITGSLTLNYADPAASTFDEFVVDISLLRSDRSRRDRAIRSRWLESATFPLATFKVTEVRGFPANPAEGKSIDFQLVGDMTVKETTREVVWDVTATLDGDRLTGSATLATFLEDFNIPVPSIAGILRVTDGIELTLDFTMEQVEGM